MKSRGILCFIMVIALAAIVLSGCTQNEAKGQAKETKVEEAAASKEAVTEETRKVKVGVSLGYVSDAFDALLYKGMMDYAEENKDTLEVMVLDAKGDANTQISNVEQLLISKIDSLLLWACEKDPLTVAVEDANQKNIPVICVNTSTSGGKFTYVGSDDVESGIIQGEWLADNLPENATYCYIMGPIGHSAQIGRKEGLEQVLSERRPDVKMLSEQSGLWDRAKGLAITEDYLKSFPDVTAIVAQNDNMALGTVEALRTANKLGKIIVAGTDATEEACMKIKAGELDMSVFQNAYEQGYRGLDVAYKTAKGEWKEGDLIIPYEKVDKTNVDEYIKRYQAE
jgi:inositol transport system substrate-binding protein